MVYPSLPAYLDPPNWNQQQQQQQQTSNQVGGVSSDGHQLLLPPLPSRPGQDGTNVPGSARLGPEGSNAAGAARPGSMTERARLAKVPQPDQVLKCPRCDSTNTKFCYFNNYSLSQPRHFCKTCRRYWTRGGALRNVPVGGGCRRNKRSKSGASGGSKLSTSSTNHVGGTSTIITPSSSSAIGIGVGSVTSHGNQLPPHIPFLASSSLHPLSEYVQTTIGLNYGVIPNAQNPVLDHQYHVGGGSSNMGLDQWRLQQLQQQIPFFAELEQQQQQQHQQQTPALGLFSFDGDNVVDGGTTFSGQQAHGKATAAGLITQLASVKMEENEQQRLNLSRQYLGLNSNIIGNDDQYWGAGAGGGGGGSTSGGVDIGWNDLSGFNSSSTGNLL